MKEIKKAISLLLCFVMLVGLMPIGVLAAEEDLVIDAAASDVQQDVSTPDEVPEPTAASEEVTETATQSEATAEVATEGTELIEVTDEPIVLNASGPQVVTDVADINATVKVFNYDSTANDKGLGPKGYVFFNGAYEKGDDGKNKYDGSDNTSGSVDGQGSSDPKYEGIGNKLNKPTMSATLGEDGYPHAEGSYTYKNEDGNNITVTYDDSMAYLFSDTISDSYHKGTMANGGGLFQLGDADDGDLNGYYYYDSKLNAAYYDQTANKFTLYDTVIRPRYIADTASDVQRSNFLPFNPLLDAEGNSLVSMDASSKKVSTAEQSGALKNYVDLFFGMTVEFDFFMPKNGEMNGSAMEFDFYGDDDVFVYIDDVLVLNIAGTHAAQSATINFKTGIATDPNGNADGKTLKAIYQASGKYTDAEIDAMFTAEGTFKDYTKHTLKFFYMERGGNISYCRLKFNMPILPPNSLTVGKELTVTGDGTAEDKIAVENSLSYQFRVWQSDAEGNVSGVLFVKPGTTYDILEGTTKVGTGTVGTDGCFSLKAGQEAQFTDMLTKGEGIVYYVVEEILPGDLAGQYGEVEYMVDESVSGTVKPDSGDAEDFSSIQTGGVSAEDSQIVVFKNKVNIENLGTLKVTKALAEGANFEDGKAFQIQVKLGGVLLPVGTEYKVGEATRTVATAGILELAINETAVLEKMILSGTEYEITELIGENDQYQATYTGTVTPDKDGYKLTATGTGVEGKFPLGGVVEVTVTNENFDFSGQIPITKTTVGNSGTASFQFAVDEVTQGEDGKWNVVTPDVSAAAITVTGDTSATANAVIAYDNTVTDKTFFYKVYEKPGTGSYIYDNTYYIVEVYVGNNTAEIKSILKNGTEATNTVAFVNQKLTSIIVTKNVLGVQTEEAFGFTATINGADTTFTLADDGTYELTNIPVGTEVTITETQTHGYHAYYQVGNGTLVESNTTTVNATEAATYVKFTNASYAVEDTVVIDYGLPVDVNVLENDLFTGNVTVSLVNGTGKYGTVTVNDNLVRYTPTTMQMNSYDEFTYIVPYSAVDNIESSFNGTLTIIPATTIYYEDSFVSYEVWSKETGSWMKTDKTWATDGTTINGVQSEDRPGDENANNYGYDQAYDNCSTYSMGSARYVTVDESTYGTAAFTFYGTGFDIVSMTSNNTGTITVKIYKGTDTSVKSIKNLSVDTYYGYTKNNAGEWVVDNNAKNALYQVPVISYNDLTYGQYTVVVKCAYNTALDHQEDTSYNFYLDAIRIYDPAGVVSGETNEVVSNAYIQDGEAYPAYQELRESIIDASNVTVKKQGNGQLVVTLTNETDTIETLDGAVFIDGNSNTQSVSEYISYGPNHELYLAKDQAIAFKVKLDKTGYTVADVQVGIKSANGKTVGYTVNDDTKSIDTSTDMYYSIKDYAIASNGTAATVTIKNTSDSILSLTDIKVTYEVAVNAVATMSVDETVEETSLIYVDAEVVSTSLMAVNPDAEVEEPTDATEPETTEPETTEPEETTEATEETSEATTEPEETEAETEEPTTEPEEETAPETEDEEETTNSFGDFLRKLFGWLFG